MSGNFKRKDSKNLCSKSHDDKTNGIMGKGNGIMGKTDEIRGKNYKVSVYATLPFLIFLSVCGFLIISYSISKYGPGISHDSIAYIYAAESFLSGRGLIYFAYDTPLIQWPPLFPLILAGLKSTGADVIVAAGFFNSLVFTLIILISGLWLLKCTEDGIIAVAGSFAMLASIPLYYVSRFIWSEPLFILLTLLFLINLDCYIRTSSPKYMAGASICTALACLTRYVGITLIISGIIILLFQKKKILNRFIEIVIYGFISALPTSIWVARNYMLTGTLTGGRPPSENTISENAGTLFKIIAAWFVPAGSENMAYSILGIFIFIASIIAIRNHSDQKSNRLAILLIFPVIYIAYLLLSASIVAFDSINNRLLVPTYIPLVLLQFFSIAYIVKTDKGKKNKIITVLVFVIIFISWIIYPISEISTDAAYAYENGAGILASKWWAQSPLIAYVKELPQNSAIYTNCPDAVYFYTGRKSMYTPKKEGPDIYGLDEFKKIVYEAENVYVAWFDVGTGNFIYNAEELANFFNVEMIKKVYDGIIYKIEK
ncbi:MAG TPA: hypothetical protein PK733_04750 [Clostridiales bacterium]|nr:hypothetical protein [Clostridiales bacterium]